MSKSFFRFGFLKRMTSPTVAEVSDIGGNTQETIVYPHGLYAKPVQKSCMINPSMNGETQNAITPMQDFIEDLEEKDVRVTDGKNEVDLNYNSGTLKISGKELANIVSKSVSITGTEDASVAGLVATLQGIIKAEVFAQVVNLQGTTINITSGGTITITAPNINLNGSCKCNGEAIVTA